MTLNLRKTGVLLKDAGVGWVADEAPVLGAALSYYTMFSIAPLLILGIAIAGMALGEEAATGEVFKSIRGLVGESGAEAIQAMVQNASKPGAGIIATIVGGATLLIGASTVFVQLQSALNRIWKVQVKPGAGVRAFIKERLLTFAMVISFGFLLLTSLMVSAVLAGVGKFMAENLPGGPVLWQVVNFVFSFGIVTTIFAAIFKFLPDAKIQWKDVWIGAAVTAILFTLGKFGIGLYLGQGSVGSAYGAAGSLVVVLVWVYYSSQIVFYGAEFTRLYAQRYGSKIVPEAHAMHIGDPARAEQAPARPNATPTDSKRPSSAPSSARTAT